MAAFQIGDVVANYPTGFEGKYLVARVIEILDETTLVVREIGGRTQWLADTAKTVMAR